MRASSPHRFSAALLAAAACGVVQLDTDARDADADGAIDGGATDTEDGGADATTTGDDGAPSCPPSDPDAAACPDGLACEPTSGDGGHACAIPVEIRGQVVDALDLTGIEGAHVVAFSTFGAPVSDVGISDSAGRYALTVSVPRDDHGEPVAPFEWTMGATANEYQSFPGGIRPAIPVSIVNVEFDGSGTDPGIIENATTTVALLPLPADEGGVRVSGVAVGAEGAGALVVAEGATPVRSAVADAAGAFTLFNVPAGQATIRAYRAGLSIEPRALSIGDVDVSDVQLSEGGSGVATVDGSVNIVSAPGGSLTSVVLVPASVFNEPLERGPVPFGLRAPDPGIAPNVSGGWTIAAVPEGTYKVLAAFENDALVRDPDESIAGTQIVEIDVAGSDLSVGESFKVTEALEVVFPGADGPELVSEPPTLTWADDSSEDGYEVVVYDALGNLVWERTDIPNVTGNNDVEVPYEGPALIPGMIYQFRGTSVKDGTRISRTEDLRGVFEFGG